MSTESFKFWDSYYSSLKHATDEQAGRLVKALCAKVFEGKDPDFDDDPSLWMAFDVMAAQAIQSRDIASQARKNGSKGGRPQSKKGSKKPSAKPAAKPESKPTAKPTPKAKRSEAKRSEASLPSEATQRPSATAADGGNASGLPKRYSDDDSA